jgi:hypothetical protein
VLLLRAVTLRRFRWELTTNRGIPRCSAAAGSVAVDGFLYELSTLGRSVVELGEGQLPASEDVDPRRTRASCVRLALPAGEIELLQCASALNGPGAERPHFDMKAVPAPIVRRSPQFGYCASAYLLRYAHQTLCCARGTTNRDRTLRRRLEKLTLTDC